MHPSITFDVIRDAIERRETSLDHPGFCIDCGEEHFECEPDARNYECENCGKLKVFGAEEILFML